ncbi:MAG TPA: HNH endonuclease signature motif containing protein, partial [Streptosporangiaceae bacterium]|nr:HNH endonuclease signature motif containing protein [Streptosporangiaceae bacterium]
LASLLRTGTLGGPAASVSLPIDLGTASDTIPAHLRRAVILRDRHCRAPGCFTPAAGCHVHHTKPRSKGGRTRLKDLILQCPFHHLIVVHTWGWTITLNPDGTTTMRSPDGSRVYRSHSPPAAA